MNGVAPAEKGTFGLLVPFRVMLEAAPKEVMNEPEKNKLPADEFVVIESTSSPAPPRPPNGAADQAEDLGPQMATDITIQQTWSNKTRQGKRNSDRTQRHKV